MSGPGGYGNPQNQQMYGHQSMQRTASGGQLNTMMPHPGMMMTSSQPQMMNQQPGIMVSQAGYAQTMGQPLPQMMTSMGPQSHMGQPMGQGMMQQPTHMGQPQPMPPTSHMNVPMSQPQSQVLGNPPHMSSQQVYIQHQQHPVVQQPQPAVSSASLYVQPRNSPHSVPAPLSQGPPSTGGPASNNPQTPMNPSSINPPSMNPSSQQHPTPATPQQAPSSVQSLPPQEPIPAPSDLPPDPISVARLLILKDLRHSIEKLSRATNEYFGPAQGNTPCPNPQSVNPQSANPMSVNPMSVNPSSVKSDEPKSVESPEKKVPLAPKDAYKNAMDEFLAVCDQIETNLLVVQEAHRQFKTFEKMLSGQVFAPNELSTVNYSNYAQGYIEPAMRIRNAIRSTLENNNAILQKLRTARKNRGISSKKLMDMTG